MRKEVKQRMDETEKYMPEVKEILLSLAPKIIRIVDATPEEDMHMGIDAWFKLDSGSVAYRVITSRDLWDKYHAVMIRCSTKYSKNSEYQKIIDNNFATYCLYTWAGTTSENKLHAWLLYDVTKLRKTCEFFEARLQGFNDGGTYITINVSDLASNGCIIACNDVVRDYLFSLVE